MSFKDYLDENRLYTTPEEKDKFLSPKALQKKNVATLFWINLIGFCGLINRDPNNAKIKDYMISGSVRISAINDDSPDLLILVKTMVDEKRIPFLVGSMITKLFALIKAGKVDKIDEDKFREILKQIPLNANTKPRPKVLRAANDFMDGTTTLDVCSDLMFKFARSRKFDHEYLDIAMPIMSKRLRGGKTADIASQTTDTTTDTSDTTDSNDIPNASSIDVPKPTVYTPKNFSEFRIEDTTTFVLSDDEKFILWRYLIDKDKSVIVHVLMQIGLTSLSEAKDIFQNYSSYKDVEIDKQGRIWKEYGHHIEDPIKWNFSMLGSYIDFFNATDDLKYEVFDNVGDYTTDFWLDEFNKNGLPYKEEYIDKMFNDLEKDPVSVADRIHNVYSEGKIWGSLKNYSDGRTENLYQVLNKANDVDLRKLSIQFGVFKHIPLEDRNGEPIDIRGVKELRIRLLKLGAQTFTATADEFELIEDKSEFLIEFLKGRFDTRAEHNKTVVKYIIASGGVAKAFAKNKLTERLISFISQDNDRLTPYVNLRSKFWSEEDDEIVRKIIRDPGGTWNWEIFKYSFTTYKPILKPEDIVKHLEIHLTRNQDVGDMYESVYEYISKAISPDLTYKLFRKFNKSDKDGYDRRSFNNSAVSIMDKLTDSQFIEILKLQTSSESKQIGRGYYRTSSIDFIEDYVKKTGRINLDQEIVDSLSKKPHIQIKKMAYYDITEAEATKNRYYGELLNAIFDENIKDIFEFSVSSMNVYAKKIWKIKAESKKADHYEFYLKTQKGAIRNVVHDVRMGILPELFTPEERMDMYRVACKQIDDKYYLHTINEIFKHDLSEQPEKAAELFLIAKEGISKDRAIAKLVTDTGVINVIKKLRMSTLSDSKKREALNNLLEAFGTGPTGSNRTRAFITRLTEATAAKQIVSAVLDDDKSPIKPLMDMDADSIRDLLKFNNFSVDKSSLPKYKKGADLLDYLNLVEKSDVEIPKLKVDKIEETEDELEFKSVELSKYYNNRHGDTAIQVLESFNVNFPTDEFEQFKIDKPKSEKIIPAFHGTGSIGASMILRFGFRVVRKSIGGVAVTGKMLGDGIYFSNVLSKSLQYLGDSGYSRGRGTIGYMLEMEATLGDNYSDYRSAGIGADHIRSPEWAVYNPKAQLKIVKAYKVKLTDSEYIKKLRKKHPKALTEDKHFGHLSKFKKMYLKERKRMGSRYAINYIFQEGYVPIGKKKAVDFTKFEKMIAENDRIFISYGQTGPVVTIKTNKKIVPIVDVPRTFEFMEYDPDGLFSQWLSLLKESKFKVK